MAIAWRWSVIDFRSAFRAAVWTAVFALLVLMAAVALAQTPAQIEACRPDAVRLCPSEVLSAIFGNREPVRACMVRNWKQVSKACKEAWK